MKDLKDVEANQLLEILQPDSLLERFAAKKANKVAVSKDFIDIKGIKGQIEKDDNCLEGKNLNPLVGFKCLHYSVTEASGQVEVTLQKKEGVNKIIKYGVRTVADTARPNHDFKPVDTCIIMNKN